MSPLPLEQTALFEPAASPSREAASSTFSGNLGLAVHRWFRYSAGFSAEWARRAIQAAMADGRRSILDPFAGSGTALLEAESCGASAVGVEAHPFIAQVARAKLLWREDSGRLLEFGASMARRARSLVRPVVDPPDLLSRCFTTDRLASLASLLRAHREMENGSPSSKLAWLAMVSILRECSGAGTAQWQYVLPAKSKAKVADPFAAFDRKIRLMASDMDSRRESGARPSARVCEDDARQCASVADQSADFVLTSPPYANNYDYADATRLEMTFLGEIAGWGDLQGRVRERLVRSCTQHISSLRSSLDEALEDEALRPILPELAPACRRLEREKPQRGGRKAYDMMVACYFADMARVWIALRRKARPGALACFVLGDSAPYGIHVPVERWHGELAVAAGFRSFRFEKTRDRNVKWKNRKHRVPLQEGRLWVEG